MRFAHKSDADFGAENAQATFTDRSPLLGREAGSMAISRTPDDVGASPGFIVVGVIYRASICLLAAESASVVFPKMRSDMKARISSRL